MGGERDSSVAGGGGVAVAEEDDNSSSQREKLPTSFRNMGDLRSWLELENESGCQFSCDAFEMEVNERQRRNAYAQVLRSYDDLGPRIDNLEDAKNIILRYTPGSWTEKVGGMKLCDFDVPKTTTLLLVGPKGSGKSSLVNRISRVFDGNFSSERAQVSYNSSIEDGTYFLQEYMIPRGSSSFCLYDTRSLSNDSSETMKILKHWMTKGVHHGELVMRDSDNYDLKTRIKCKARQSDSLQSETRVVNFVIFVVNGMSILKSIVCQSRQSETDEETKACYTRLVAEMFNSPFLSFRDDKPVVVVTHGDLLSLSDRARVRVHLGELFGVPPKTQIFDITESCDPATELTIVDMLRYSLKHADRNLPGKGLRTSEVSVLSIPSRMRTLRLVVLGMVMINLVAQFHEATSGGEGDGTESNFSGLVSTSALGSKDKPTELNMAKSTTSRGKKKEMLQMLQKADAQGTTSDLYMAYKGPEEKREAPASMESTESSSSITLKQESTDTSDGDVLSNEKCANNKPEPDDWEDAADIATPKLDTLHDGKKASQELKLHGKDEIEGMTKKYSKDFLLKFSELRNELREAFKIQSQGITSDLHMAYKRPREKREAPASLESTESSSSITLKQVSADASDLDVLSNEKCANYKPEPDDWENATDISTLKLDTFHNRKKASQELKLHVKDETEGMTKKYSRDFLLKFSEQCNELPEAFKIQSELAEALISSNVNFPQESYPSSGRVVDRPALRPRLDRPASFQGEEDKWSKMPRLIAEGRDLWLDDGYVGNLQGFRPGSGGNYGVLRNQRAQTPVQHVGSILSGLMQSPGPQGGMQRNNIDSDCWQHSSSFHKGLIPSPQTPLQVMHKADQKYKVGKITDEEQAKQRVLKGILNKLTLQNFDKLFEQVKQVNIDNAGTLSGLVAQIFDKALMEPTFCEMYANFCHHLAGELPVFSKNKEKITFKKLLLDKCQEEFERGEREQEEANRVEEEGEVKQTEEEREEKRIKARRRMLGTIRLIEELNKKRMLSKRIMHEYYEVVGRVSES